MITPSALSIDQAITRPVNEAGVQRILAIRDPVLRNLWITLAYHDLALGMADVLGSRDVTWVAFATSASKTAGVSIRCDQLGDLLRSDWQRILRERQPHRHITPHLLPAHADLDVDAVIWPILGPAVDQMSKLIAEGNRSVFEELGPLFARIITTCQTAAVGSASIEAFLESVSALDNKDADATPRLRDAFRSYFRSRTERSNTTKAQAILLAGGLIGYTEQIRLQSVIEASLNAVVAVPLNDVLAKVFSAFVRFPPELQPRTVFDKIAAELEAGWREVVTRFLLRLKTPEMVLDLSKDVPPASVDQQFPDDLLHITDPDASAFLNRHDRTNGKGQPSGAHDWADLRDRMNYIVNLFRSWQQNGALLRSPFTAEQIAAMQDGQIPTPPL